MLGPGLSPCMLSTGEAGCVSLCRTTLAWPLCALIPFISLQSPSSRRQHRALCCRVVPPGQKLPAAIRMPLGRTRCLRPSLRSPCCFPISARAVPPLGELPYFSLLQNRSAQRSRRQPLFETGYLPRPEPLLEQLYPSSSIPCPTFVGQRSDNCHGRAAGPAAPRSQHGGHCPFSAELRATPCATPLEFSTARASPGLPPAQDVRGALRAYLAQIEQGGKKKRQLSALLRPPEPL